MSVTEKLFQMEKKGVKTWTEVEYASVEDPLNIHRSVSNQASLVSDIPSINYEQKVIIGPGQGVKPVSI